MYISCLPANCNISPNISTLIPPTFLQSSHFNLYVLWKIFILVYSAVLFVWCSNNWVSLQLRVAPPFPSSDEYFKLFHWEKVIFLKCACLKRYKLNSVKPMLRSQSAFWCSSFKFELSLRRYLQTGTDFQKSLILPS